MNDKLAALDQENWFAAEDKSSMLQADTLAVDPTISRRQPDRLLNGVVIGTLAQIDENGHPLVDFAGNSTGQPLPARSTASLCPNDIGREVAMMFESGDPRRPVVLGAIAPPQPAQDRAGDRQPAKDAPPLEAEIDGRRVVLSAEKEIVLRCGKASITLTRAGKILVRGAYLLSRSSGVNRIKGGSVQIN